MLHKTISERREWLSWVLLHWKLEAHWTQPDSPLPKSAVRQEVGTKPYGQTADCTQQLTSQLSDQGSNSRERSVVDWTALKKHVKTWNWGQIWDKTVEGRKYLLCSDFTSNIYYFAINDIFWFQWPIWGGKMGENEVFKPHISCLQNTQIRGQDEDFRPHFVDLGHHKYRVKLNIFREDL